MAVIAKKDEKVAEVVAQLQPEFSPEEFIGKFKQLFPKEWTKIERAYSDHLRKAKPGQKIPMPKPEQYLINALNVWSKNQKSA